MIAAYQAEVQSTVLAALRRGRLPAQASATLAQKAWLAMNKAWRRQSSAERAARAVTDLCDTNQVWTTVFRPLRAHTDAELREAAEQANELHAAGALFVREIVPEPAPADPADWAMAEASDD